jgi:hypothetical protein
VEKHIDLILKEIGLHPATHEPCIYTGTIDEQRVIFLRQVDDFAVAAKDETTAWKLINQILQLFYWDGCSHFWSTYDF